ncbi:hypothetical protein H2198_000171 [Neophaeococcomyces mojaviensis]|uniref:Uncharacterized protein n=1 Tax=Neophaeococcomyces mojaviensis TaxID=3383035 RepID=A0ACC3AKK4_9EURO|nr:hypothetical protein H2198_000171 [Knufia sp. JES_112]
MSQPTLVTRPPQCVNFRLTFPASYVLLVTFEREKAMNSLTFAMHWALAAVWDWFDREPNLRVAVVTGQGIKSFCAGQDLLELRGRGTDDDPRRYIYPKGGFAGISRRSGKKPIVAAVNGYALGGGFEMALNCDMVVASPTASFGLPEAIRGLYAAAGGLPRLMHIVGPFIATEIALTGRRLSAQEALAYKLANRISKTNESCVDEAIELAQKCAEVSPDAALVSRVALREAWETGSVERGVELVEDRYRKQLHEGENMREGLRAFAEKRKPNWAASKL